MRAALTNEEKETVETLVKNTLGDTAHIVTIDKEYTIEHGFTITFIVIHNSIKRMYKLGKTLFASFV